MNREIKFRLWDERKKEWSFDRDFLLSLDGEVLFNIGYGGKSKLDYSCRDQIICQFTGLKDKNGKEIYEGDILQAHVFGRTYTKECIFLDGVFTYKETIYDWDCLADCHLDWEVIGNIHENKDLIDV